MEKLTFRRLKASEIDCRVGTLKRDGKGCSILLYKDARVDMALLDEVVGPMNWQRLHEFKDGKNYCKVGIFDSVKNQWIWKEDVGVESNTQAEKGQASDAFKRACFNIGIGRELYTAPFIWIADGDKDTKLLCKSIGYDGEGSINQLSLTDLNGNEVFVFPKKKVTAKKQTEKPKEEPKPEAPKPEASKSVATPTATPIPPKPLEEPKSEIAGSYFNEQQLYVLDKAYKAESMPALTGLCIEAKAAGIWNDDMKVEFTQIKLSHGWN